MSISQGTIIKLTDFLNLISNVQTEINRRQYNPQLTFTTPTFVTSGANIYATAANVLTIINNVEQINTTAATTPQSGITKILEDLQLINDEIATYATANVTDATTYCTSSCAGLCFGCTGSCLGQCLTTCTASCADDCTSTCANDCGSSCGSDCAKNSNCSNNCAINCAAMCSGSCSGSCGNNCTRAGNCTIACASWCKAQSSA